MKVVIVGSGNVASHLAKAFVDVPEVQLLAILSRNGSHAVELAREIGFTGYAGDDFGKIRELRPDIVLISVADRGLDNIVRSIGKLDYDPLVVHTSGTVPKEVLSAVSKRTGVFYPFQTFSRNVPVDVSKIPVFTEVSDNSDRQIITELAESVTESVHYADSDRRKALHIAGVLSCNFTNFLLELTGNHLEKNGMTLDVVEALVRTTVDKAFDIGPHKSQTGPAVRGDFEVLKSQEASLEEPVKSLYHTFSRLILDAHNIHYEQDQL